MLTHYSDGTQAKAGDLVIGKTYNTPYRTIGVIHSITEAESCNCQVQQLFGVIESDAGRSYVQLSKSDHAAVKDLRRID